MVLQWAKYVQEAIWYKITPIIIFKVNICNVNFFSDIVEVLTWIRIHAECVTACATDIVPYILERWFCQY